MCVVLGVRSANLKSSRLLFPSAVGRGKGATGMLRSVVLGAALGGSVGAPAGLLQEKAIQMMPEEVQQKRQGARRDTDAILAGNGTPFISFHLSPFFVLFDPNSRWMSSVFETFLARFLLTD
jgi:hypothetical protein